MMDHRFQINLSGLIDLLSNHLYTRPDVFVRELLQNGIDAISARFQRGRAHHGSIHIELAADGQAVTFTDNGIGLTEEEMHRFLAVIGESSKRSDWLDTPTDFIGQFGIGLLACFVVADEIELVSRSAATDAAPTLRWRGRPDGTYTVERLAEDAPVGTRVTLVAKREWRPLLSFDALVDSAAYYGSVLPWPIQVAQGDRSARINTPGPTGGYPWDADHLPEAARKAFWLEYGRRHLDADVFDAIPLRSDAGGVTGIAFVLSRASVHSGRDRHRVYLKRMLLSDKVQDLLPDWAFFVQCVIDCTKLKPTASRNAFHEDAILQQTRQELGECLRQYLIDLTERDPGRLLMLMSYHHLAFKALALEDDDFFKLIAPWFPLETNFGRCTLQAYLERNPRIVCAPNIDEFRQIAQVAAAQQIRIVNGGYTYDADLLARYGQLHPEVEVRFIKASDIGHQLQDPDPRRALDYMPFLAQANAALEPFDCIARVKLFEPNDLPTLFISDRDAALSRQIKASQDVASELWHGVLEELRPARQYSELSFNLDNPLIQRLVQHPDAALVQRVVQILYVQSLLLGHYPLGNRELALMNEGFTVLLERSLVGSGASTRWH